MTERPGGNINLYKIKKLAPRSAQARRLGGGRFYVLPDFGGGYCFGLESAPPTMPVAAEGGVLFYNEVLRVCLG